jgi:hypothetical protein
LLCCSLVWNCQISRYIKCCCLETTSAAIVSQMERCRYHPWGHATPGGQVETRFFCGFLTPIVSLTGEASSLKLGQLPQLPFGSGVPSVFLEFFFCFFSNASLKDQFAVWNMNQLCLHLSLDSALSQYEHGLWSHSDVPLESGCINPVWPLGALVWLCRLGSILAYSSEQLWGWKDVMHFKCSEQYVAWKWQLV